MQLFAALSVLSLSIVPLPAHASVIDSTVEDGGTLSEAVDALSITMNEEILQVAGVETANVLTLQDSAGNYYGDGCTSIDGTSASMNAALGEQGDYVFSYTVVSADTHPVSGQINFTWEPPADFEPAPAFTQAPVCGEALPEPVQTEETVDENQQTETNDDTAATDEVDETDTAETAPSEETADDGAGTPAWVFVLVSIAAVALIIGLIIGNWMRARRMRAYTGEDPEAADESIEDQGERNR